jgi:hypothetical protein
MIEKKKCPYCENHFNIRIDNKPVNDFEEHFCEKLGGKYKDYQKSNNLTTQGYYKKTPHISILIVGVLFLTIGIIGLI